MLKQGYFRFTNYDLRFVIWGLNSQFQIVNRIFPKIGRNIHENVREAAITRSLIQGVYQESLPLRPLIF